MRRFLVTTAMALACAACATSTTDRVPSGSHVVVVERECRNLRPIGSNIPQRVCASPAEWAERDRVERENTEEIERQQKTGSNQ